jgi:hypothetical protein
MRKGIRITGSLILAVWLMWVYGSWTGLLPSELFKPGPITLALLFFVTPFFSVILIGMSNRSGVRPSVQHRRSVSQGGPKSTLRAFLQVLPIAAAVWFCSAFVAMFLSDRYPVLHPFVWWTFAVCAGVFFAAVLSFILFSIGYGAVETLRMYRYAVEVGRLGKVGRFFLAVYFAVAFAVALFFVRW